MEEERKDAVDNAANEAKNDVFEMASAAGIPLQPAVAPARKDAKRNFGSPIMWIVIIALIAGAVVWVVFFNYTPKFSVDGTEFTMKSKVKELLDGGLILCDSNGIELDMNKTLLPSSLDQTLYYVCKKAVLEGHGNKTGFVIQLFNSASSTKKRSECSIYCVYYYPDYTIDDTKVLVSGQDFSKLSRDTAKKLCMDAKMQFKEADLDKFASGGVDYVLKSGQTYRWELKVDNDRYHLYFQRNDLKVDYGK